jgi:hypothetical protein
MKNQTTNPYWKRALCVLSLSPLMALNGLMGQENDNDNASEDVFELSPFTVTSSTAEGYYDSSTLAGTRLKGQVRDVGASIQILTDELMEDIGASDVNDLMLYTTGTESGGMDGNYSGSEVAAERGLQVTGSQNQPHLNLRIRGLGGALLTRDFLRTRISMDRYNTERVTINRGANAILFGLGNPAGIVNNSLKKARLTKDSTSLQFRLSNSFMGEDASYRAIADFNKVLIDDRLAVRVALMEEDINFSQKPAFDRDSRQYVTTTFKPFKNTIIRAHYERGDIAANRPDPTGPYESISTYVNLVRDLETATGAFTPLVIDTFAYGMKTENPIWGSHPSATYPGKKISDFMKAPHVGKTITFVWDGDPEGVSYNIQPVVPADKNNGGLERTSRIYSAINVGDKLTLAKQGYNFHGLKGFELFDWAENLIGGSNGFQNRDYENYNVTLEQVALNGNLGFELIYDFQTSGRQSFNPYRAQFSGFHVDINTTLPDGRTNPNLGRPFIMSRSQVNLVDEKVDAETLRATGFYRIDFEDVLGEDSWVSRLLGQHTFTGVFEKFSEEILNRKEAEGFFAPEEANFDAIFGVSRYPRSTSVMSYIGPAVDLYNPDLSLSDFTIDLDLVEANNYLLGNGTFVDDVLYYDNKTAGSRGFKTTTVERRNYQQDIQFQTRDIESIGFSWQAHLLDRHIVPTVGWRRDEYTDFVVSETQHPTEPLAYVLDWEGAEPPVHGEESGITWGVVAYWPRDFIPLPSGTDISFHYSSSSNFEPDPNRQDPWGNALPAPTGDSKDYGVTISMFDNKFVAKVSWFEATLKDRTNNRMGTNFQKAIYQVGEQLVDQIFNSKFTYDPTEYDPAEFAEEFPNWDKLDSNLAALQEFFAFDIVNDQIVFDDSQENAKVLQQTSPALLFTDGEISGFDLPWANQLKDTEDKSAEGIEIELTYNPTRNWRIAMNIAKITTVTDNSIPRLTDWMENSFKPILDNPDIMNVRWSDPAKAVVVDDQTFQTVQDWWDANIVVPVNGVRAYNGIASPDTRKWRVNFITNYSFRDGFLKGFNVGTTVRWQDKNIIGNDVIFLPDGTFVPDVNKPYYGPTNTNVDLIFGYTRKIFNNKVRWKVQLNIRNAFFDKDDVIPISTQPDGSIAEVRLAPPRVFMLTNTFSW